MWSAIGLYFATMLAGLVAGRVIRRAWRRHQARRHMRAMGLMPKARWETPRLRMERPGAVAERLYNKRSGAV